MDMNLRSYAKARVTHKLKNSPKPVPIQRPRVEGDTNTESQIKTPPEPNREGGNLVIQNVCLAGDPGERRVSIIIEAGRITDVVRENGDAPNQDSNTRLVDGAGATVLPGFTDAHLHLIVGAEQQDSCNVEDVTDRDTLSRRISDYATEHPDLSVIFVHGLHYLDPPLITSTAARRDLDQIVADRPVFVYAHDLHTGWANTKALEESGHLHPMPPFPTIIEELDMTENIRLDTEGIPTGELKEPEAYFLVDAALRSKYPQTHEQKLASLRAACLDLASYGITSVHNMGLTLPEEDIELVMLLLELEEKNQLPIRVYSSYSVVPDERMLEDVHAAAELRDTISAARRGTISADDLHRYLMEKLEQAVATQRWMSDSAETETYHAAHPHAHASRIHLEPHQESLERRLRESSAAGIQPMGKVFVNAVKIFMDGVIEQDTAYRMDTQPAEGIPAFDKNTLTQTVQLADRLGLPVRAHSIGDGSVRMLLDAVASARVVNADVDAERGHRIRHRIEHIELCQKDDISRFSEQEVVPSMQPFHERGPSDPPSLWFQKVSEAEWETAFPWNSLVQTGARLIFGSDWPIVSCDCLGAMRHAISRKAWRAGMPNQGLCFADAAAGFCSNPAYAVYEEQVSGRVEPGMIADLVILSDNLGPNGDKLNETTEAAFTICNGTVVYEKSKP